MALKQEETETIKFDDLEYEAEYVDESELETKKYYTISGKESWYEPTWTKYTIADLDVGDEFEGRPELMRFENKDKSYDAYRLRVMDDGEMVGRPEITIYENEGKTYNAMRVRVLDDGEILNCYFNYPKKDYPYVKNINKEFDFYRPCFDFIYSILKYRDERNVVKNGEEVNVFKSVNIETFAKYVDQMERIGVRITKGKSKDDYNRWEIYKME